MRSLFKCSTAGGSATSALYAPYCAACDPNHTRRIRWWKLFLCVKCRRYHCRACVASPDAAEPRCRTCAPKPAQTSEPAKAGAA